MYAVLLGLATLLLALLPLYFTFLPPILDLKERSGEFKTSERLKTLEDKFDRLDAKISNRGPN
jgi:hypothetical protein